MTIGISTIPFVTNFTLDALKLLPVIVSYTIPTAGSISPLGPLFAKANSGLVVKSNVPFKYPNSVPGIASKLLKYLPST